ncbi:MAG: hypothetical protein ACRCZS_01400 [Chroococcidiopsis sp.]
MLSEGRYIVSSTSLIFPDFPATEGISQFFALSRTAGTRPALKAFRTWIKERRRSQERSSELGGQF